MGAQQGWQSAPPLQQSEAARVYPCCGRIPVDPSRLIGVCRAVPGRGDRRFDSSGQISGHPHPVGVRWSIVFAMRMGAGVGDGRGGFMDRASGLLVVSTVAVVACTGAQVNISSVPVSTDDAKPKRCSLVG